MFALKFSKKRKISLVIDIIMRKQLIVKKEDIDFDDSPEKTSRFGQRQNSRDSIKALLKGIRDADSERKQ